MNINFLQIRIEPYYWMQDSLDKEKWTMRQVKVSVKVNGTEYHFQEVLVESDFESIFDWMMERMIHEIKNKFK